MAKKNFGLAGVLNVTNKQNAYLQFVLDTLPLGTTATEINKATLKLWVGKVTKAGSVRLTKAGDGTLLVERTINGTNAPGATDTTLATLALDATDAQGFVTIDVTAYVKSLPVSPTALVTFALSQDTPGVAGASVPM